MFITIPCRHCGRRTDAYSIKGNMSETIRCSECLQIYSLRKYGEKEVLQ